MTGDPQSWGTGRSDAGAQVSPACHHSLSIFVFHSCISFALLWGFLLFSLWQNTHHIKFTVFATFHCHSSEIRSTHTDVPPSHRPSPEHFPLPRPSLCPHEALSPAPASGTPDSTSYPYGFGYSKCIRSMESCCSRPLVMGLLFTLQHTLKVHPCGSAAQNLLPL